MRTAPCYAGGGAVSVLATARGIVAFDIQIEFGAATAIQFGPLTGYGRVTTGLYMFASEDGGRLLEGFVHARGEGQVACFGISVNLEVRVTDSGGQMIGSTSYRFRFKVGLASVGYTVRANYTFKGGGGSSTSRAIPAVTSEREAIPLPLPPEKSKKWPKYQSHFVREWL